jgi:predicted CXXCH cytochrome family protein
MRVRAIVLLAAAAVAGGSIQASILDSKHNLSVSSPGSVRAQTEGRVCVFCHTPHRANVQAPLWNRADPGTTYIMYWSPTMDAYPSAAAADQPSGASKLCLSCHDGTIALGSTVATGTIEMEGGVTTLPTASPAFIGQDLSGDHPVSFVVTQELIDTNNSKGDVPLKSLTQIRDNKEVRLDSQDRIQCSTCHDPHDNTNEYFLLKSTSELCIDCHD